MLSCGRALALSVACLLLCRLHAFNRFSSNYIAHSLPRLNNVRQYALEDNNDRDIGPSSSLTASPNSFDSPAIIDPPQRSENFAILLVYFVQGTLGLSRLAVTFFLKDQLGLSPAESSALLGITSIPWIMKPVYGFITDGIPLFGYKRRSYLMLSGILGSLAWLAMGTIVHDATSLLTAVTLSSLSIAFSDVVVDSIVVERSKRSPAASNGGEGAGSMGDLAVAGDLQSQCWAMAAIGGILSAYFSGSLLEKVPVQTVFLTTAFFPLLISLASFAVKDPKVTAATLSIGNTLALVQSKSKEIWETIRQPNIYLPVLFVFLWQATPSPDSAMFYFYTSALHFSPEFLGRLRLVSSIASLLGVAIYRTYLKDVPIKQILFWSVLVSVPLGLTQTLLTTRYNQQLGIPDDWFTLTDSVVLTVLGQVSFMPLLALAAALCPVGVEGTLFATLMAIYNSAGTLSSELGAGLTSLLHVTDTDFSNLTWLVVICSVSSLLPLPFIGSFLDSKRFDKQPKS